MKYFIKLDNYKRFEVFKENVLLPRSYFIPFANAEELSGTDIRNERYSSSRVKCLSGEWDFAYYKDCRKVKSVVDMGAFECQKITVPSVWSRIGCEEPCYLNTRYEFTPNLPDPPEKVPMGLYRKAFTVENLSMNHTISFLGVSGAFDLFCNGKYVGYSEGSHNTAEFELNEFLKYGSNELVVALYKWSNGSYLECQDMFRETGIFRDVLIYITEDNSIYDFEIKTVYQGEKSYSLSVKPALKLLHDCELAGFLYDGENLVASVSANASKTLAPTLNFGTLEVEEWSAESPYLYDLVLVLARQGEVVEAVRRPVGFKHIEINGNVFYFNSQPIKLLGVNHHDTDPVKGFALSPEDMERDVRIFKQFNVNCVRTSHYPPDPMFLDLCDEYGVYVVDEADIETHGCWSEIKKPGACSHNPDWQDRYWDRVYRMFERDKNHAGIVMWSLGNEAYGYKNQDYCYERLKDYTLIPIHYEGVSRTRRWAYDVVSQMYPWQGRIRKIAAGRGLPKKYYTKPYFMCEYAHAMGVGAGELETYVSTFLGAENMMGGCIWEFADHAVYHEDGKYKYTYGGDHGEEKHDGNFCVDGLFFPDRTPHSGAYQMKNCYRPVRAEFGKNRVTFRNLKYFTNAGYTVKWHTVNPSCEGGKSGEISLNIPPRGECSYDLDCGSDTVVLRYFDGDFEVASESHSFGEGSTLLYKDGECAVTCQAEAESFDINVGGIPAKLGVSIFRAPLDNDRYLNKVWEKFDLAGEHLRLIKSKNNVSKYMLMSGKGKHLATVKITEEQKGSGVILKLRCTGSKRIPFIPRFGFTAELPAGFDSVKYYGLGDMPNLPDFKEHVMPGVYETTVDGMREKYIKPQEASMRSGVVWAQVGNGSDSVMFNCTNGTMIFSADKFTSQQCAAAKHQEELELSDKTYLHLDAYQLGAASGACGPLPTKQYRKHRLGGTELELYICKI